jgi:hypothetical protein
VVEKKEASVVDILDSVNKQMAAVRTASLDLSFNELADMYKNGELIIRPEYQRLFRWDEGTQSRFIESLILEMPIPPIFVMERDEGRYELIDGLQRLSTYLHFRGLLKEGNKKVPQFCLVDCDIVNQLDGHEYQQLPPTLQIRLKRSFVRVEVLRKESDDRMKYHMFKRLNTGGAPLSEQEVRNCTIRLLDSKFNDFVIKISEYSKFQDCIRPISDERSMSRYDQELVLRFFAFKNDMSNYRHDVSVFLTMFMEKVSMNDMPFDYDSEKKIFESTFNILSKIYKERSFGNIQNGEVTARFMSTQFEPIVLGIQPFLEAMKNDLERDSSGLRELFKEIKKSEKFIRLTTGGGKNSTKQLNERIKFVSDRLAGRYVH